MRLVVVFDFETAHIVAAAVARWLDALYVMFDGFFMLYMNVLCVHWIEIDGAGGKFIIIFQTYKHIFVHSMWHFINDCLV